LKKTKSLKRKEKL